MATVSRSRDEVMEDKMVRAILQLQVGGRWIRRRSKLRLKQVVRTDK